LGVLPERHLFDKQSRAGIVDKKDFLTRLLRCLVWRIMSVAQKSLREQQLDD